MKYLLVLLITLLPLRALTAVPVLPTVPLSGVTAYPLTGSGTSLTVPPGSATMVLPSYPIDETYTPDKPYCLEPCPNPVAKKKKKHKPTFTLLAPDDLLYVQIPKGDMERNTLTDRAFTSDGSSELPKSWFTVPTLPTFSLIPYVGLTEMSGSGYNPNPNGSFGLDFMVHISSEWSVVAGIMHDSQSIDSVAVQPWVKWAQDHNGSNADLMDYSETTLSLGVRRYFSIMTGVSPFLGLALAHTSDSLNYSSNMVSTLTRYGFSGYNQSYSMNAWEMIPAVGVDFAISTSFSIEAAMQIAFPFSTQESGLNQVSHEECHYYYCQTWTTSDSDRLADGDAIAKALRFSTLVGVRFDF